MKWCITVLKELTIRLRLYLFGIRFYECDDEVDHPLIREASYWLDADHRIRIHFFRVACTDIVMKSGQLVGECYTSYIVKAYFSENFPPDARAFDRRAFYFNGRLNGFAEDEAQTTELLLDVYLDFIKTSLLSKFTSSVCNQEN